VSDLSDAQAVAAADGAKANAAITAELGGDQARAVRAGLVVFCPRCQAAVPSTDRLAAHDHVHQLGG
jgi:hypothetical protein